MSIEDKRAIAYAILEDTIEEPTSWSIHDLLVGYEERLSYEQSVSLVMNVMQYFYSRGYIKFVMYSYGGEYYIELNSKESVRVLNDHRWWNSAESEKSNTLFVIITENGEECLVKKQLSDFDKFVRVQCKLLKRGLCS